MLEYEIVQKNQFTVAGISRKFNSDTSCREIPKFWEEFSASGLTDEIGVTYGLCVDEQNNGEFTYYIADDYIPWLEYSPEVETKVIPAHTWAVFPCFGKLPQSIQSLSEQIFKEWLAANGKYRAADNFSIEFYFPSDDEEDYCEIWLPVEEIA